MLLKFVAFLCALSQAIPCHTAEIGYSTPDVSRLIVFKHACKGQFPYQAVLQLMHGSNTSALDDRRVCGGAILSERVIITSAQCVIPIIDYGLEDDLAIIVGRQIIDTSEADEQLVRAKSLSYNPKFDPSMTGSPNDIGFVVLSTSLVFTDTVSPILLPKPDSSSFRKSILAGWGLIQEGPNKGQRNLQYSNVNVFPPTSCRNKYRRALGTDLNEQFTDSVMCAGSLLGGFLNCKSRPGDPLVVLNEDGEYELTGVMSWGTIPCNWKGLPSIYTNVVGHLDYINDYVQSWNISTT